MRHSHLPTHNCFFRAFNRPLGALVLLLWFGASGVLPAADATWTGATNGDWNNNGNWSAAFPNSNNPGDTATFNNSVNTTISLNQTIGVHEMVFTSANVGSFTFNAGGGTLNLGVNSGTPSITMDSTVGAVTQTFNPTINIVVNGNPLITNNSAGGAFNFAGGFDNTTAANKTILFTGSSTAVSTIGNLTQSGGSNLLLNFQGTNAGTYNLTGTNNYSGLTTVAGGVVRLSGSNAGSGALNLSGGTLQINTNDTRGGLGTGALTHGSSGVLQAFGQNRTMSIATYNLNNTAIFSGDHSLTINATTITSSNNAGTFTNNVASGQSVTITGTNFYLNVDDGATNNSAKTFTGTGDWVVNTNISNAAGTVGNPTRIYGITKSGTGTMRLGGTNTYNGTTTITNGVLVLDSANALPGGIGTTGGTSALTVNGGILGLGAGDLTRAAGTGVTQISVANGGFAAYGADRIVNLGGAGATVAWTNASFMNGSGTFQLGATNSTHMLDFQNNINLANANRTVQVNDGSAAIDGRISGVISSTTAASGILTKTGAGTLELTGNNTFTGGININSGTLIAGSSGALSTAGTISFGGGALQHSAANTTDYSSRFSNAAGQAYAINTGGQNIVWNTGLSSSGGTLAKSGSGSLTLNGTNTYTGTTSVNGGTLLVNGSISGSAVTVSSGGRLGGSGTIAGSTTTIQSGGVHAPGNSPGVQTFNNDNLTYNTSSTFEWELFSNTDSLSDRGNATIGFDGVNLTGTSVLTIQSGVTARLIFDGSTDFGAGFWSSNQSWLVFDAASLAQTSLGSGSIFDTIQVVDNATGTAPGSGSFSFVQDGGTGDIYLNYTAIPEPSTYAMALGGLAALVFLRRRAKKTNA